MSEECRSKLSGRLAGWKTRLAQAPDTGDPDWVAMCQHMVASYEAVLDDLRAEEIAEAARQKADERRAHQAERGEAAASVQAERSAKLAELGIRKL